jgi:hypothetical protein
MLRKLHAKSLIQPKDSNTIGFEVVSKLTENFDKEIAI